MKKKQEMTILEWCKTQEEKTNRVVDELLDNHDINDKKIKKALTITSKILKSIDELKEITKEIVK